MEKIFTLLMVWLSAIAVNAASPSQPRPHLQAPADPAPLALQEIQVAEPLGEVSDETADWTEWTQIGTGSFLLDSDFAEFCSANFGFELEQNFPVMRRDDRADPSRAQFRFDLVLGGIDLILDYDSKVSENITVSPQVTKLPFHDFFMGEGFEYEPYYGVRSHNSHSRYDPSTGKFEIIMWLLVSPSQGLTSARVEVQINDVVPAAGMYVTPETRIAGPDKHSVALDIRLYGEAAFARCLSSYGESVSDERIAQALAGDPAADYQDVTDGRYEISFDQGAGVYSYYVVAMTDDGRDTGLSERGSILSNQSDGQQWESMGYGLFSDPFNFTDAVWERDDYGVFRPYSVEVERCVSEPGFYRIVNPYKDCPYDLRGYVLDRSCDYYLVIDARDPDKVVMPERVIGLCYKFGIELYPVYCSLEASGTLRDSRIRITDRIPNGYRFELKLPDYVGYEMERVGSSDGDRMYVADKAVKSVRYAYVPAELAEESEAEVLSVRGVADDAVLRLIAAGDPRITYVDMPRDEASDLVTVTDPDDLPSGKYYMGMCAYDAAGVQHGGVVEPLEVLPWSYLGTGRFHDGVFQSLFGGLDDFEPESDVKVYHSPVSSEILKIESPYAMYGKEFESGKYTPKLGYVDKSLYINISDPSKVVICDPYGKRYSYFDDTQCSTGLMWDGEPIYLTTYRSGSMSESRILFGQDALCAGVVMDGALEWYDVNDPTYLILPGQMGVGEVAAPDADADAPVSYYNLQGLPVSHPSGGVYIVRQGSKVSKQYIP